LESPESYGDNGGAFGKRTFQAALAPSLVGRCQSVDAKWVQAADLFGIGEVSIVKGGNSFFRWDSAAEQRGPQSVDADTGARDRAQPGYSDAAALEGALIGDGDAH
jgi:hypothetical protein